VLERLPFDSRIIRHDERRQQAVHMPHTTPFISSKNAEVAVEAGQLLLSLHQPEQQFTALAFIEAAQICRVRIKAPIRRLMRSVREYSRYLPPLRTNDWRPRLHDEHQVVEYLAPVVADCERPEDRYGVLVASVTNERHDIRLDR